MPTHSSRLTRIVNLSPRTALAVFCGMALTAFVVAADDPPPANTEGFTDTPMLPGGKWHIHDPNRPQPPIVTPGKAFSQGANAPSDAIVLFDGTDFSQWVGE